MNDYYIYLAVIFDFVVENINKGTLLELMTVLLNIIEHYEYY